MKQIVPKQNTEYTARDLQTGKGLHHMIQIITYARNRLLSILATDLVRLSLYKEIL